MRESTMKTNMNIFILISSFLLFPFLSKASLLEMNLKHDSIYTPGSINITMKVTNMTNFESGYKLKISIFLTGTLIREQTIEADRDKPVNFELNVPEVFDRTEGRCRCELLIGDNFLEAQEVPVILWPATEPYPQESIKDKQIWVYDTSGKLLDLFRKMEVKVVDATFKTARDFGKPDIVFAGQNLDPNNMRILTNSIISAKTEPVVIYLKQKQFSKESKIEVIPDNNSVQTITLTRNNIFLTGLNFRDVMRLANNSNCLKIKTDEDTERTTNSWINEMVKDEKNIYSYLLTIKQKNEAAVYCQLPITDSGDPRCAVLLKNLLTYAQNVRDEIKR
jgi:hypothetical protein